MKIIMLMLSLIILSCEDSNTFDDEQNQENTYPKHVVLENNRYNDCHRGCYYYFNILTTIKEVNEKALNLSLTNINDFDKECKKFCNTTPELNNQKSKIEMEIKPFEDKIEESSNKVEKKQEKKKNKSMELTPFEEL